MISFGHLAGDQYLTSVSQAIVENLPRSTDFAARYGGDEFVIVLYDTDRAGAHLVAKAVREVVNNISINPEFSFSAEIQTTVSSGLISIIPDRNVTSNQLIRAADKALYQVKQQGRNRICAGELTLN